MTTTESYELTHDGIVDLLMYARYVAELEGKRLLLDAFCCQGAMTSGYQDAGFIVVGVDVDPKALKRYVGNFRIQHDAVEFINLYGGWFDAASAGPPCQAYSKTHRINRSEFPKLIEQTRDALEIQGKPWVIENVMDAVSGDNAEMRCDLMLCGAMFGLHTYRHRAFEFGHWDGPPQTGHERHVKPTVKMGRALREGDFYHAVGNFQQVGYVRRDLNLPWMNRDGLRECAPRQYAQYIGVYLQQWLDGIEDGWMSTLERNGLVAPC